MESAPAGFPESGRQRERIPEQKQQQAPVQRKGPPEENSGFSTGKTYDIFTETTNLSVL